MLLYNSSEEHPKQRSYMSQWLFIPTLAALLFLALLPDIALGLELSDSSRISLLTCSPGEELYSAFGHNGIRVTDYKNDFDVVFNYGTFDFGQPGFYTNFLKGRMLYMISTDRFSDFLEQYTYERRSVRELELQLDTAERKKIFAFLYHNALPGNREYYYDFFWDNCATRIRDVFEKILGARLQYEINPAKFEQNKTMHDMLRIYVHDRPWVDFGFDLILGMPCEVAATPRNQTFLPDYLEKYFECASVDGEPFSGKTEALLSFPPAVTDTLYKPLYISLVLAFLGLLLWWYELKKQVHFFGLDFVIFLFTGLLGTLFLSLWLFSAHFSVPWNLNLIWLIPTHVLIAPMLLMRRKAKWLSFYFGGTACILIVLLLVGNWLPQHLNIAFQPLLFLLIIRSSSVALYINKQTAK